jgi:hypothetical protein
MEDPELRAAIEATRIHLKATQRTVRGALQFLADLDEKLAAAAQPKEGTANGTNPAAEEARV